MRMKNIAETSVAAQKSCLITKKLPIQQLQLVRCSLTGTWTTFEVVHQAAAPKQHIHPRVAMSNEAGDCVHAGNVVRMSAMWAATVRLSLGVLGISIIGKTIEQSFQLLILLLACEVVSALTQVCGQQPSYREVLQEAHARASGAFEQLNVHPITLEYSDPKLEREYATALFVSSSNIVARGCFTVAVFLPFLACFVFGNRPPAGFAASAGFLSTGLVRLVVARMADQTKAMMIFSWLNVALVSTSLFAMWCLQRTRVLYKDGSPALIACWSAVYFMLCAVRSSA